MLGHNRKMSGAECLADMLKGYGVTHVFHVPAVLRKTFAVMESRTDIKRLHVHGEKAAAYMADGYARASRKVGICMAQTVGAAHLAAGLKDARLGGSPVLALFTSTHAEIWLPGTTRESGTCSSASSTRVRCTLSTRVRECGPDRTPTRSSTLPSSPSGMGTSR